MIASWGLANWAAAGDDQSGASIVQTTAATMDSFFIGQTPCGWATAGRLARRPDSRTIPPAPVARPGRYTSAASSPAGGPWARRAAPGRR
ncbi:Uncharacterised protein [Bordetella pertussis]|nr:Uncharacterised protein [Bordetella pertussis]